MRTTHKQNLLTKKSDDLQENWCNNCMTCKGNYSFFFIIIEAIGRLIVVASRPKRPPLYDETSIADSRLVHTTFQEVANQGEKSRKAFLPL